jgi:hypothetical protein
MCYTAIISHGFSKAWRCTDFNMSTISTKLNFAASARAEGNLNLLFLDDKVNNIMNSDVQDISH